MKYINLQTPEKQIQLPGFGLITVAHRTQLTDSLRDKAIERYFPSLVVEILADKPVAQAKVEDIKAPEPKEEVKPEPEEVKEEVKEETKTEEVEPEEVEVEVKPETKPRGRKATTK